MLPADWLYVLFVADPEVHMHNLITEDEFMVVACDGLWDMLSSQRCIEIARQHLRDHNDPRSCAQYLVNCSPVTFPRALAIWVFLAFAGAYSKSCILITAWNEGHRPGSGLTSMGNKQGYIGFAH